MSIVFFLKYLHLWHKLSLFIYSLAVKIFFTINCSIIVSIGRLSDLGCGSAFGGAECFGVKLDVRNWVKVFANFKKNASIRNFVKWYLFRPII